MSVILVLCLLTMASETMGSKIKLIESAGGYFISFSICCKKINCPHLYCVYASKLDKCHCSNKEPILDQINYDY